MHNQPKYRPLRGTAFFADGASARPLVEGTVARGTLQEDEAFFTGKVGTATVRELPFAVDDAVLERGQERYNIYCTPCHDATGGGKGMVVQRGYKAAAVVPRRAPAERRRRLFLRRDDQRVRRDAGLPDAAVGPRSLGGGRLHPRAAAQSARRARPTPRRRSDQGPARRAAASPVPVKH